MPKTNGTKGTSKKQWDGEFPIDPHNQQARVKGKKKKKPGKKKQKLDHTHRWRNDYTSYTNLEYNKKPVYKLKGRKCEICGATKVKRTYQYYIKVGNEFEVVSESETVDMRKFREEKFDWPSELRAKMTKHYGKKVGVSIFGYFGEKDTIYYIKEDMAGTADIFDIDIRNLVLSNPEPGYESDLEMWNEYLLKLKIKNDEMRAEWYKEMDGQ